MSRGTCHPGSGNLAMRANVIGLALSGKIAADATLPLASGGAKRGGSANCTKRGEAQPTTSPARSAERSRVTDGKDAGNMAPMLTYLGSPVSAFLGRLWAHRFFRHLLLPRESDAQAPLSHSLRR